MAVSGPTLGNVKAKMTLDIADFVRDSARVQKIGKDMGRSFSTVNTSLGRTEQKLRSVGNTAQTTFGKMGSSIRGLGASISALAGPFGIVFGAAGLAQLGRFALAVDELATSYKRQSIAAVNLAGSQANLNALMEAYDRATGGAIDKATALGDVTRLQAIGFADSAQELERFVTVARGISLAMGKSQEYIIGEVQLAIANQSMRRLDQIGLGVGEVTQRIDELREANSSLTREMAFQEAVLAIAEEKYGALAQSAEAQATGAERAAKAWKDMRLEIGLLIASPVGDQMQSIADTFNAINVALAIGNDQLDKYAGSLERVGGLSGALRTLASFLNPAGGIRNLVVGGVNQYGESRASRQEAERANLAARAGGMAGAIRGTNTFGRTIGAGAATGPDFSGQTDAIQAWADQIQTIEEQANQSRLDATQRYEQQRTNTIAQFEKTIAREAEDFARQRARAEASHIRAVQDVREAAVRRESSLTEDHAERVEEINEGHADKLEDIEKNSARQRLDLQESHRDTILKAAGRLDAAAIAQENRRYQTQLRKIDRDEKEKTKDANKSTSERLKDENKGFEERRDAARKADEERIRDMEDNFQEQKQLEDDDRALRLGRMREDHEAQLTAQDTTHSLRLEQIEQHAADEREQLDTEFEKALADEDIATQAFITSQELRAAAALKIFEDWWDDLNTVMGGGGTGGAGGGAGTDSGDPSTMQQFARGGAVAGTGRAMMHAGEYVLNSNVTDSLRAMMGNFSQPELVNAVAGGGGSSVSLTVAPGAIQINGADSPGDIADQVEAALLNAVRGIA